MECRGENYKCDQNSVLL
jgi:hypothetical protein